MSDVVAAAGVDEVPIWPALVVPVLEELRAGDVFHRKDLARAAALRAGLSEAALEETLQSGQLRYQHRVGWVLSHLSKAGWVERPERAHYQITAAGLKWLDTNPQGLDYSSARELLAPFWEEDNQRAAAKRASASGSSQALVEPTTPINDLDPVDQIEHGIARIHTEVGDALLERLRNSHPDFFEEAVVALLLAMGYGGAEQRGRRIGGTGDGGVDGVIDQDPLGLEQIYIQAKRYALGSNVQREAIQAFVGALHGVGASRGVFITTSGFSTGAKEYARAVQSRIILIDAERLATLMIKYGVGVQAKDTYTTVELDEDFFA
ncbi:restriction endonuclease [Curtobacterium oceanosedimentum]|uniref:Restriction endonuclease n=1 Tax=Curtobacterium oceanosedimentum TaxID=465820 RepID=A0A147DRJ0_9MICO|nr:restriction endonuclease [Curtobacterium oceanosedimentum]